MTSDELREHLSYDPLTGVFTWARGGRHIRKGARAGNVSVNGYERICIHQTFYQSHRLAWLYVTGSWPKEDIDHFNGNRSDNRWSNLRSVSRSQNLQNMAYVKGFQKNHNRYMARLQLNGKAVYLGTFDTPELARAAYLAGKKKYHPGTRYD